MFLSKNLQNNFATSPSPALLGCYWLYTKWPANRSDCTLRSELFSYLLCELGKNTQFFLNMPVYRTQALKKKCNLVISALTSQPALTTDLYDLLDVKLPCDPVCPSVGWSVCCSVGLFVIISSFQAPIGALVIYNPSLR